MTTLNPNLTLFPKQQLFNLTKSNEIKVSILPGSPLDIEQAEKVFALLYKEFSMVSLQGPEFKEHVLRLSQASKACFPKKVLKNKCASFFLVLICRFGTKTGFLCNMFFRPFQLRFNLKK